MPTPEVAGIRLAECTLTPPAEFGLGTQFSQIKKQRINIDTEVPRDIRGTFEVRCRYQREASDESGGWLISYQVGFRDVEEGTPQDEIVATAIATAHPYVRSLLLQLGAYMLNETLSLPAQAPKVGA